MRATCKAIPPPHWAGGADWGWVAATITIFCHVCQRNYYQVWLLSPSPRCLLSLLAHLFSHRSWAPTITTIMLGAGLHITSQASEKSTEPLERSARTVPLSLKEWPTKWPTEIKNAPEGAFLLGHWRKRSPTRLTFFEASWYQLKILSNWFKTI